MNSKGAKTIVVAYVGETADSYIKNSQGRIPDDLEIYCWDKEGCTNPRVIQRLISSGVRVYFADDLHMKLYHANNGSAVVGSPNLSWNGLDDAGLKEVAVEIPAGAVDIEAIVNRLGAKRVSDASLSDLFKRTDAYRNRNNGKDVFSRPALLADKYRHKSQVPSFDEWMRLDGGKHHQWKMLVWDEYYDKDPEALENELTENNYDYWSGTKWITQPDEWLLSVDTRGYEVEWCMANRQIAMKKNDENYDADKHETHYAIADKRPHLSNAPFNCSEEYFRKAICDFLMERSIQTYGEAADHFKMQKGRISVKDLRGLKRFYDKRKAHG